MARPLRIEFPGAIYHITSRGNERKAIFRDDRDRKLFLDTLEDVTLRYNWLCHAYCLMENHYHLLTDTPDGNLSIGMGKTHGDVGAKGNNKEHKTWHGVRKRVDWGHLKASEMVWKLGDTEASVARSLGMMTSSVNRMANLKDMTQLCG